LCVKGRVIFAMETEAATTEYLRVAFPTLDEDDKTMLKTLLKQFADELQAGGPRPRLSITRNLVQMTEQQISQAIEMYENTAAPKPAGLAEASDVGVGADKNAVKEMSDSKPASNGHIDNQDEQSHEAGSPGNTPQRPQASNKSSENVRIKPSREDYHEEADDYSRWTEDNSWYETDWQWSGSERVLTDCRAHFAQIEQANPLSKQKQQSLLSQVGISLSRVSRDHLAARGMKLKRFLAGYAEEFTVEGSLDGRVAVTHYPLDKGGSEGVLQECRAHLDSQPERQELLSKLGASLSASSRAYLEQKNLKLKRFLMKYSPEFSMDDCDAGRDTVTLTNSDWVPLSNTNKSHGSYRPNSENHKTWYGGGWRPYEENYKDENPVAKNASWFQ